MYCGSCLHDNAIAKAMMELGHDAMLVPTYTPILTDEANVSSDKLFYGGLNVYLQQLSPIFRWLPRWSDSFLSSPSLVRWVASRAMGTTADKLGPLTVSMLRGTEGNQRKEVRRLCDWLQSQSPDIVIFSNLLIAGCVSQIKKQLKCPVVVILQGDDIFYDSLTEPFRGLAMQELRRLAKQVDRFIVNSQDYADRMQEMLGFPKDRVWLSPLSIDTSDFHTGFPILHAAPRPPTVGYLARLAPEKGLHRLVDAFILLAARDGMTDTRLRIAGWLGGQHTEYFEQQKAKLNAAGLEARYEYSGSVDRAGKLEFLRSIDVLSVPTTYQEPKGLFVLEGLAAGVPYVLPAHGAFPELHRKHQAGHLFAPESTEELADRLQELLANPPAAAELGAAGRESVLAHASTQAEAKHWIELFEELTNPS